MINSQGYDVSEKPTFVVELDQSFVKDKKGVLKPPSECQPSDEWYVNQWGLAAHDIACEGVTYQDLFDNITATIKNLFDGSKQESTPE